MVSLQWNYETSLFIPVPRAYTNWPRLGSVWCIATRRHKQKRKTGTHGQTNIISHILENIFCLFGDPPCTDEKGQGPIPAFFTWNFFDLAVLWLAVVARIQQLTAPIWPSLQSVRSTSKTSILHWSVTGRLRFPRSTILQKHVKHVIWQLQNIILQITATVHPSINMCLLLVKHCLDLSHVQQATVKGAMSHCTNCNRGGYRYSIKFLLMLV